MENASEGFIYMLMAQTLRKKKMNVVPSVESSVPLPYPQSNSKRLFKNVQCITQASLKFTGLPQPSKCWDS